MEAIIVGIIAGVLAAVGGLLKLVLDHVHRTEASNQKEREETTERFLQAVEKQRAMFEGFLSNHLSANTRALQDVEKALRELTYELHRR